MYWIDNNTGIPTPPSTPAVVSPSKRYFTNGGAGVQPTTPEDFWFHMVQEELLGVLTMAGIAPNKSDLNQVAAALVATFTKNTDFPAFFNQNGWQKLSSGLIIQWGLSAPTTTSVAVTFPVAFPNAHRYVFTTNATSATGAPVSASLWAIGALSLTGFTAINIGAISQPSPGAAPALVPASNSGCPWFAIGY